MARLLSRSVLELALTRTDPHPTGTFPTAESIKIYSGGEPNANLHGLWHGPHQCLQAHMESKQFGKDNHGL
jgi:hypothetical protein